MKKILLTGATGFIGQHLYQKLKELGCQVTGISFEGGEVVGDKITALDITDKKALENFFGDQNFDIVFHLAAVRNGTDKSLEAAGRCFSINGFGTLNILEQLKKQKKGKMVYASTLEVYGRKKTLSLISEEALPQPKSFYGISKLLGEYYCQKYFNDFHLPYICLRYAPVYGKGQLATSLTSIFIERAKNNEDIIIFGQGKGCLDLVFIEDVIGITWLTGISSKTGIFNIGSGSVINIRELAEMIKKIWSSRSKIVFDETKTENCYNIELDIQKAKQQLNHSPKYPLLAGLEKLKSQLNA